MRKLFFVLVILSVLIISGCVESNGVSNVKYSQPEYTPPPSCPTSCDDSDNCTRDYCSKDTDYNCTHQVVKPCCGDGVCEAGEPISCQDCKYNFKTKPDFVIYVGDIFTNWSSADKGQLESIVLTLTTNTDRIIQPLIGMEIKSSLGDKLVINKTGVAIDSNEFVKPGEYTTFNIIEPVNFSAKTAYTVKFYLYDKSEPKKVLATYTKTFEVG